MKQFCVLLLILSAIATTGGAQQVIPLYPEGVKNSQPSSETETRKKDQILWVSNIVEPTLEIYLPAKANNTKKAVLICPGGGYSGLAYDWEGTDIAQWLNSLGIAAFVLKYRMPNSPSVQIGRLAPLQDAQRAIRIIRSRAAEWNVHPTKIGVMGFSAGGHLASTLGTHFDYKHERFFNPQSIDTVSARPDFMVLMYPVITMDDAFTHLGSRKNLIGEYPSSELVNFYSNEKHTSPQTPPTFLIHAADDEVVPVENSIRFFSSLQEQGVPAEMHIYPYGGHGFSLAIGKGYLQSWTDRLKDWLENLE